MDVTINNTECLVCMKPAQGLHYQVPCCNGCRSFFRRTILQKTKYAECSRNGVCYSSVLPVKCRTCRFQKCINVGMIAQIGTLRKNQSDILKINDPVEALVSDLMHLEKVLSKIKNSKFDVFIYPSLEKIVQSPSQISYASKFEPMSGWPLTQSEYFQKQKQLTNFKIMIENNQLEQSCIDINTKEWPTFGMILSIEYTKTFPFFTKLSFADRLCLVQGSAFMLHVATTTFNSYEAKKDIVQTPDGFCMTELMITSLVRMHTAADIYKSSSKKTHWKFVLRLLEPLLRDKFTHPEYLLLKAIIVTNPALDLSQEGQKIVQEERNKYARALLDLCLLNHGRVNGPSRFLTVLNYIYLMEDHQRFFREFMTISQLFKSTQFSKSRRKLENEILCISLK